MVSSGTLGPEAGVSSTQSATSATGDSQSYVYPVRSLLSSRIQPAPDQNPRPPLFTSGRQSLDSHPGVPQAEPPAAADVNSFVIPYWTKDRTDAGTTPSGYANDPKPSRAANSTPSQQALCQRPKNDSQMVLEGLEPAARLLNPRRSSQYDSRNFRHFPAEDNDSENPRTFSRKTSEKTSPLSSPPLAMVENMESVLNSTSPTPPESKPHSNQGTRVKPTMPLIGPSTTNLPDASLEVSPALPFNPSEYGIVHLPPLVTSPILGVVGMVPAKLKDYVSGTSAGSSFKSPPKVDALSYAFTEIPGPLQIPSFHSDYSSPGDHSGSGSLSESFADNIPSSSIAPLFDFTYEHAEDENGNHVITGRQGILQRMEDEPICTPGAVQAFGVLIAVEETETALVVHQVSENSTELLGFSPSFLFSLECFTDTLPEAQGKLLWDNIQFLGESGNSAEEDGGESPHVFLLSGWGAPGSASPDSDERRYWTCWCAVHRPATTSHPSSRTSNLIIMEFEWEKDVLNPLYPPIVHPLPVVASPTSSGPISPSNSSTSSSDLTVTPEEVPSYFELQPSKPSQLPTIAEAASFSNINASSMGNVTQSAGFSSESNSGSDDWLPSLEDIFESTTNYAKPVPALERLWRMQMANTPSSPDANDPHIGPHARKSQRARARTGNEDTGVGMMDVFAVMGQINDQLGATSSLETFLKVLVGLIKALTHFHRVLVYKFDDAWNGQVVAELVDHTKTKDLYKGLHFPAADVPAQARALYSINKVRLVYDRSQSTARIVVRSKEDLETPLNMTHCYTRAMSPVHIKYLENMGVRASMSVSIIVSGTLWGLVTCHSFGSHGMRVPFPVRQMLRLLSQSISRNIERLGFVQRVSTRRLINTMVSDRHPTGYIVSNVENLLGLFDADFGILVIGEGAKILGPNQHGQEILIMAEYLRLKQYNTIQASQAVINDFPDLQLTTGLKVIAGLLLVPLSIEGNDFMAFLRKGKPRRLHWAGKPYRGAQELESFEPRSSFKVWSETVAGGCRDWTDEQLETAGLLSLIYGKFIEVWRQKENALQTTEMTDILLSNAGHEVRTPLNHIVNYLEMALNGPLDAEVRDNLSRSHAASKSLLFTINDLLDLTRLESGHETSFHEPFDLQVAIEQATNLYRKEAERRNIGFYLKLDDSPRAVIGDVKKIRTVVQNLTANSLKYITKGSITVYCSTFGEPKGLRSSHQTAVNILIADTGCGIPPDKLDIIFREFEQVESTEQDITGDSGVGLGLAVVARIVRQLGGQLRVESKVDEGSQFSFLIPLALAIESTPTLGLADSYPAPLPALLGDSGAAPAMSLDSRSTSKGTTSSPPSLANMVFGGFDIFGTQVSKKAVKMGNVGLEAAVMNGGSSPRSPSRPPFITSLSSSDTDPNNLRVLIVEDNFINRTILAKRLRMDGHTVVNATNGQEGLDAVKLDKFFDIVLMDLQMPIMNGFQATQEIRTLEKGIPNNYRKTIRRISQEVNGRLPIFAVSASLPEHQRGELLECGMDGWIVKPIDFRRLNVILKGVTDPTQRKQDVYRPGCNWEGGGWLQD